MAYHTDCDCASCVALRDEMFDDYCITVEVALETHGYALPKAEGNGEDIVSCLATQMMIAAGLIEDPDYDEPMPTPRHHEIMALGCEIDAEYRRLFRPNVVLFRKPTKAKRA